MRIFISHSTKNKEIVLKFAELLENISSDIEVFCSSQNSSIKIGENFIETIFKELNESDVFLPIISEEYYTSRFCMIELGVAYSYLYNKYNKKGEEYIFPFALYPVNKVNALSGTPIVSIQTGNLNDEKDIRNFLECLSSEKGLSISSGINRKLHEFKFEIDQILLKKQNIINTARIHTYFDDSINYIHREDIVNCSITKEELVINYNMNPYEKEVFKKPNFISVVLSYVDKFDINRYLDFNYEAEFKFVLTNFTNSLKRIFIEFKYSDSNRILETFEVPIKYGKNEINIPLYKMKNIALSNISEICFVIHPDDVAEDEGMFKINELHID